MAQADKRRGTLRRCAVCGELTQMDARAIYCSAACKQSAYRLRKKHQVKRQRCILCQVKQRAESGGDAGQAGGVLPSPPPPLSGSSVRGSWSDRPIADRSFRRGRNRPARELVARHDCRAACRRPRPGNSVGLHEVATKVMKAWVASFSAWTGWDDTRPIPRCREVTLRAYANPVNRWGQSFGAPARRPA